jgi:hypothetical protein
MHKMRAKLYPSYLPGTEGYIARTTNEASVNIEDICASMKNRGGFDGSYEEAVKSMRHFFMEMLYQLADGFSVNTGYFTVHPNIGGTFKNENEAHNHKDHPISFRFQALKPMRDIRDDIDVIIDGIADTKGYIMDFTDIETGAVNELFAQLGMFIITGHNIKLEGGHPDIGVYFQRDNDPNQTVKVDRILENNPSKIVGIAPNTAYPLSRVAVITQYSSGNITLKDIRIIKSPFTVEKA